MRFQIRVQAAQLGLSVPVSPELARALVDQVAERWRAAGLTARRGVDFADVGEDEDTWPLLHAAEREAGGYEYPTIDIDGAGGELAIAVFKDKAFVVCDSLGADDEQATAARVMTALRAIEDVIPIPASQWRDVVEQAGAVAVAPDGSIRRPVISWAEQSERAVALFDRVFAIERPRPNAAAFIDARLPTLSRHSLAAGPLRVWVAAAPGGEAFAMSVSRDIDGVTDLQDAMMDTLSTALKQPWQATGLPTALVVDIGRDGQLAAAFLVFDNLVDSGAVEPSVRLQRHRTAPFAWESIALAARRRNLDYQPEWLGEALDIIQAGGQDIPAADDRTLQSCPDMGAVGTAPEARRLRSGRPDRGAGRIDRWSSETGRDRRCNRVAVSDGARVGPTYALGVGDLPGGAASGLRATIASSRPR